MAYNTRATTSRVAKQKAQARLKRLVGAQNEVTFPSLGGYNTIDEYHDTVNSDESSQKVEQDRVRGLEQDVKAVQGQVHGINQKIDLLIDAVYQRNDPISHSTPPRHGNDPRQMLELDDTVPYQPLPPPRRLRQHENRDGYVDNMARSDRFDHAHTQGKNNNSSDKPTEREIRKPYMYIQRESCQTDKQKLEVRCSLSSLEYVNATLALIRDRKAYDPVDQPAILRHLQDVTRDAIERPWHAVRRWSQFVWDTVELGDIKWQDYQQIQNERVRLAMTAPGCATSQIHRGEEAQEYICREFQSRTGCRHRSSHMEGAVKLLHICAFCDSISRQCPHSVTACGKKMLYPPRNGPIADHYTGIAQQQQQSWRTQMQPTAPHQPQHFSKNGLAAPRQ